MYIVVAVRRLLLVIKEARVSRVCGPCVLGYRRVPASAGIGCGTARGSRGVSAVAGDISARRGLRLIRGSKYSVQFQIVRLRDVDGLDGSYMGVGPGRHRAGRSVVRGVAVYAGQGS